MKWAVCIIFALALAGAGPLVCAKELSDPQGSFSITIPDGFAYEPNFTAAPDMHGFFQPDRAGGIGTVIFLKWLDSQSLDQASLSPPENPPSAEIPISWAGGKLNATEVSQSLFGVPVVSFHVQAPIKDGAVILVVIGSPNQKPRLLALLEQVLSSLKAPAKTRSSALANAATPAPPPPVIHRATPLSWPVTSCIAGSIIVLCIPFRFAYRAVGRDWSGVGLSYLIVLLLACYIPDGFQAQTTFNSLWGHIDPLAGESPFPILTLKNGSASISEPEPYLWRDSGNGAPLLYFDSTGAFNLPDGRNATILLDRSHATLQLVPGERPILAFKGLNASIDKNRAAQAFNLARKWLGVSVVAAEFVFGFLWHFGVQMALVYGFVAWVFGRILGANLRYAACMRLSGIAITPLVILGAVLNFTHFTLPYALLIKSSVELVILLVAVGANAAHRPAPSGEIRRVPPIPPTVIAHPPPIPLWAPPVATVPPQAPKGETSPKEGSNE